MLYIFAAIVFAIWIYLIARRSRFWRAGERHDCSVPPCPSNWPDIVAVIPARNEAETIAAVRGVQSALDHARGRGGEWKGRFHAAAGNVR